MKNKTVQVVCFGDSLTEASGEAEGGKWPTLLQNQLEIRHPGKFVVYNRGVSGNTTALALDRIDAAVLPLLPAWVIVEFGGNDANVRPNRETPRVGEKEFLANLAEIDRLVRGGGGRTLLVAIHPPAPDARTKAEGRKYDQGNGKTYEENFAPYRKGILAYARRNKIPVLDIGSRLSTRGMSVQDIVIRDGIHLTTEGNRFYAEEIFEKFFAE